MNAKAVAVVSYIIGLISCDAVTLTCPEISGKPMTDISSIYNCKPVYIPESGDVVCPGHIASWEDYTISIIFRTLEEVPTINNSSSNVTSFCLGLYNITVIIVDRGSYYWKEVSRYTVEFNSSMAVSILQIDRRIQKYESSYNISLLNDILQLSVFYNISSPWNIDFWDFSSPLYGMDLRWFQGLSVSDESVSSLYFEPLQNTSIQLLNISTFFLNENETVLFKHMPLLRTLIIKYSHITSFDNDSFIGTPEIENLIVVKSKLTGIPEIIERIPNLKNLDFSSSAFEISEFTIPRRALSSLKKLESLNLGNNLLFHISGKLPQLPKLKKLILCECRISVINESDLILFPALQQLDLSGNSLSYLNASTFIYLRNLEILDLSQNRLINWPNLHSISLRNLNLAQNSLTYMENLGKTGVSVEFLNISMNKIRKWEDQQMFSFAKLGTNALRNNMDKGIIHGLKLFKLKREGTGIEYIMRFVTQQKAKLNSNSARTNSLWTSNVDLSNNLIAGLTEVMMKSLNGFRQLDLGGNQFDCVDCRMLPFQRWLNTTSIRVTNLGTQDPLLCSSPINNKGTPVVTVQFDESLCLVKRANLWIVIGIPIAIGLVIISVAFGVLYSFRSPIAYMIHLYKIRRRARCFSGSVYNKYAFDAFICYSAHNRKFVLTKLAPMLEQGCERYTLCLHERDFPLGSHIVENIVGSIQHSRKTIIVLSEHFINSKWCKWEMEMANHKMFHDDEHFLILIQLEKLDRSKLPRHLQFLMDTRTYLEWPDAGQKEEQMYQRLKTALGSSIFQRTNERAPLLSDVMSDY